MKVERISGCRRHLEYIQYCFSFQSYLLLLWKWNKIEMSTIYIKRIIFASLYVWKGLSFLCQVFVFSCVRFTTCTLLHTTQLFKKLDFYHFDSLLLSTLFIHNSIWNSQSSYSLLKKSVRTRKTWFDTPLVLVRNPNCRRGPFAVSVYCQWVVTSLLRKLRIALNVLIWHFWHSKFSFQ